MTPASQTLDPEQLRKIDAWWRAATYRSVGQIYFYDNPLLKEPLALAHIKPRLLGQTQAGRVRYDLAQRLDESHNDFMAAMLRRIDATLVGIETAVGQGLATGEQGAAQAEAPAREPDTELARLNELAERLPALAAQTDAT